MAAPVIIANTSGFYGDRLSAPAEMVRGGPIDVLTGDYLAELTMAILARRRMTDPSAGYVPTFLRQMETILGECLDRSIRVVANAGGLNPRGLAAELERIASRLGLRPRIAFIEGDDLLPRLSDLARDGEPLAHMDTGVPLRDAPGPVVTANAYLGGWGIREALARGADVVICPRVTDAALVVGPAAWKLGWSRADWDKLAGAVAAGHIIECGTQATGGNYAFFDEVPSFRAVGFPIAEIHEDGSFVITKHPGTGGLVSVGTVTAQLLYEIQGARYASPDVIAHFDSLSLRQEGPDRVLVTGARGEPPPETSKASVHVMGGFRNSMTILLAGLAIDKKAAIIEETLFENLGGKAAFDSVDIRLSHLEPADPAKDEGPLATMAISVTSRDARLAGKRFSAEVVALALASVPGFTALAPPEDARPFVLPWPALLSSRHLRQTIVMDGEPFEVEERPEVTDRASPASPPLPSASPALPDHGAPSASEGELVKAPIGRLFGARSGDKGGNANLGVWAKTPAAHAFLRRFLSIQKLRELIPSAAAPGVEIERAELPNLLALNFVLKGLLGGGAGASPRIDPQAKTLGEVFRSRIVEIPAALLRGEADAPSP
jgi:hypothetical protein